MIHLVWPWVLLALPLPLLIRRLSPAVTEDREAALIVTFLSDFTETGIAREMRSSKWRVTLAVLAWLCLLLAGARPQWMDEPIEQAVSGRDLMLAVDLSGSMDIEDFIIGNQRVDRLTATKRVAGEFINRRAGDRLGLILFGTQAYLQTPLTFDRKTVTTLLEESVIGLAGENTAIGDAIGLAVKRLGKLDTDSRVLVLLTDGANNAGEVLPLKAAELAAESGLKIYTIGIGADEMIIRGFFGNRRVNPSQDLDEATLTKIAEITGGQYFRARDTEQLEQIYKELDYLEPVEKEQQYFRPRSELYYWPLALALLCLMSICLKDLYR